MHPDKLSMNYLMRSSSRVVIIEPGYKAMRLRIINDDQSASSLRGELGATVYLIQGSPNRRANRLDGVCNGVWTGLAITVLIGQLATTLIMI